MRKLLMAMALALAGCEHEPTAQEFANACQSYGFHPDTPEMAQCIQREALAWRQRTTDDLYSSRPAARSRSRY